MGGVLGCRFLLAKACTREGQGTTCRNHFSPSTTLDRTQVVRLGGDHLYVLSPPAAPLSCSLSIFHCLDSVLSDSANFQSVLHSTDSVSLPYNSFSNAATLVNACPGQTVPTNSTSALWTISFIFLASPISLTLC